MRKTIAVSFTSEQFTVITGEIAKVKRADTRCTENMTIAEFLVKFAQDIGYIKAQEIDIYG